MMSGETRPVCVSIAVQPHGLGIGLKQTNGRQLQTPVKGTALLTAQDRSISACVVLAHRFHHVQRALEGEEATPPGRGLEEFSVMNRVIVVDGQDRVYQIGVSLRRRPTTTTKKDRSTVS